MVQHHTFDETHYQGFYNYPRTRITDIETVDALRDFVLLFAVSRSTGATGARHRLWEDAIARHYPNARYSGVEFSEFLCEKYGWIHGSVVDFKARSAFDLVICMDVLQYST